MRSLFITFFLSVLVSGCNFEESNTQKDQQQTQQTFKHKKAIVGFIDEHFLSELKKRETKIDTIIVASLGGETTEGLKIAREILDNQLNVIVADICLSACAEYLLPAANNVGLINEPLIGYHWNPIILGYLLRSNARKDIKYCTKIGDDELLKLLSDSGKKMDAWKHILERISLKNYAIDYKQNSCPWSVKEFENDFWFPTSEQLENLFGITVSGKLCADNPKCYQKKLHHYFKREGGSFIVGDLKVVVPKATAD